MGFLLWLFAICIFVGGTYKAIKALMAGDPVIAIFIFLATCIIASLVGPIGISVFQ